MPKKTPEPEQAPKTTKGDADESAEDNTEA